MSRYNNVQLVGLGGTGCNIIETFVRYLVENPAVLKEPRTRFAFLAFDVAEPDIASLRKTFAELEKTVRELGVPADKVHLIADTVRFPTVETLYNFVQRWPEFWEEPPEEAPAMGYKPFLDRSVDIPPLVGGVGRKRALSKAIYGLNYHLLKVVGDKMELFKQRVLNAEGPLVCVVYGMGGGSGSGMALDFARHLRQKLGRNIPIFGLGILPCPGDDPAAKGASAYAALAEHEALLDRTANDNLVATLGESFTNPFNFYITVPLGPAFTRSANLIEAKKHVDEAIVDSLFKTLNFDINDMFTGLGDASSEGRWVNTLSTMQVSIPIPEHIELARLEIERLELLRSINVERRELFGDPIHPEDGAVSRLIGDAERDVLAGYRAQLVALDEYEEERFTTRVAERLRDSLGTSIEQYFQRNLTAQAGSLRALGSELSGALRALGLGAKDGDLKKHIHQQAMEVLNLVERLPQGYAQLEENASPRLEDIEKLTASLTDLTPQERQILKDLREIVFLIGKFLRLLRKTEEISTMGEAVLKDLTHLQEGQRNEALVARLRRVRDLEIPVARQLLVSMVTPAEREKDMDLLAHQARSVRIAYDGDRKAHETDADAIGDQMRRIDARIDAKRKEMSALNFMKHRSIKADLEKLERERATARRRHEEVQETLVQLEHRRGVYELVERKLGVNAEYRKIVRNLVQTREKAYQKLNAASRDRGLYHRVKELTETERLRILQRVLADDAFRAGDLVQTIVDREDLTQSLKMALSNFRNPTTLGLTGAFRTENLWFVVLANKDLWTNDLTTEVKSVLSGYVAHDVDRAITVRLVDSQDPFRIRFLLVTARAAPDELEAFTEMESLYTRTATHDRKMAHSLGLERGGSMERSGVFAPFIEGAPAGGLGKRVVP